MRELLQGVWCRLGLSFETGKLALYLGLAKLLGALAWAMFHLSAYKALSARVDNGDWQFWRASTMAWRERRERNLVTQALCRVNWVAHRRFLWCVRWVPLCVLPQVLERARRMVQTNEETHG
jgi:hypothetical protein